MNAKEIMDKKFDKGFNGYKMDDVDEFLRDISIEFTQLQKDNIDLEKKLEVLADKIREYREDEDALKEALLGAQKQSRELISTTQEKADKMIAEASAKAAKIVKDAEDNIVAKKELAKKIEADANANKAKILQDAKAEADKLHADMMQQNARDVEILAKTRDESQKFTALVLAAYEKHIADLKTIPSAYANDFVKAAKAAPVPPVKVSEPEKKPEPVVEAPKAVEAPKPAEPKKEEIAKEIKEEISDIGATSEIAFQPVFEEAPEDEDVEEYTENKKDSPFFEKPHKSSHEKLEFGKNK